MEEILKCELCNNKFNLDNRRPLNIKCGHSYCASCIMGITSNQDKAQTYSCPHCKVPYILNMESCIPNFKLEEIIKYVFNSNSNKTHKQLIYMKPGAKRNKSPVAQEINVVNRNSYNGKATQISNTIKIDKLKECIDNINIDEEKNMLSKTFETIPLFEEDKDGEMNTSFEDDFKDLLNENIDIEKGKSEECVVKGNNVKFKKKMNEKELINIDSNVDESDSNRGIKIQNNSNNLHDTNSNERVNTMPNNKTFIKNQFNNNINVNSFNNNNDCVSPRIKTSLDDDICFKTGNSFKQNSTNISNIKSNKLNSNDQTNINNQCRIQLQQLNTQHQTFKSKMINLQKKTNSVMNCFNNNTNPLNTNNYFNNINNHNFYTTNPLPVTINKLRMNVPYNHPHNIDSGALSSRIQNNSSSPNSSNDKLSTTIELNKTFQKLKNELMLYLQPSSSKYHPVNIRKYEEQIYKAISHPKFKNNLSSLTVRLLPPEELFVGTSNFGVIYASNGEYHEGNFDL